MLYIDEVNLLDDHIVNIILDVSSTGILTVQREGLDQELPVQFSLVGTMNPEEGGLRPQLLDRFGLMVDVGVETDVAARAEILRAVLMLDEALAQPTSDFLERRREEDRVLKQRLDAARNRPVRRQGRARYGVAMCRGGCAVSVSWTSGRNRDGACRPCACRI